MMTNVKAAHFNTMKVNGEQSYKKQDFTLACKIVYF